MRRHAILAAVFGLVLGSLSSASAKEFIQFECGRPQSADLSAITIDNSSASDPSIITTIFSAPTPPRNCSSLLKVLFQLGYKLISAVPRPLAGTPSQNVTIEGGIVYLLEK
jgi:hypothetical protein